MQEKTLAHYNITCAASYLCDRQSVGIGIHHSSLTFYDAKSRIMGLAPLRYGVDAVRLAPRGVSHVVASHVAGPCETSKPVPWALCVQYWREGDGVLRRYALSVDMYSLPGMSGWAYSPSLIEEVKTLPEDSVLSLAEMIIDCTTGALNAGR